MPRAVTRQIAIIGAGPSGMAAALQLKRSGILSLLFESRKNDSLLLNAWQIENYLGLPGISGRELFRKFRRQLKENDITPITEKVLKLNFDESEQIFIVKTLHKYYRAARVIIASGTQPKKISKLENVSQSIAPYIFYEILPLLNVHNKTILIMGAGDAAFDYALNLAEKNNKVYIINRGDRIKALLKLEQKALRNKNIRYDHKLKLVNVEKGQNKNLKISFLSDKGQKNFESDYLVVAVGRIAQKDFYAKNLLVNEKKLIKKKLLYLIGDIKNKDYRQITIALADGILAAMKICREVIK